MPALKNKKKQGITFWHEIIYESLMPTFGRST